jgi:hypothetical protein
MQSIGFINPLTETTFAPVSAAIGDVFETCIGSEFERFPVQPGLPRKLA